MQGMAVRETQVLLMAPPLSIEMRPLRRGHESCIGQREQADLQANEDGPCTCRGWAVSVTQVLLMASPLSTIYKAIQQRTSASFHLGLCAMGLVTSTMWVIFALVSLRLSPCMSSHVCAYRDEARRLDACSCLLRIRLHLFQRTTPFNNPPPMDPAERFSCVNNGSSVGR